MALTLPIVVGKKYVRRDGVVVTASEPGKHYAKTLPRSFVCVAQGEENRESGRYNAFASNGRILPVSTSDHEMDLVADHVEPAKGHPHAALMMEFAKDAAEGETPWDRWQCDFGVGKWGLLDEVPRWAEEYQYRRAPMTIADPHAESMKLYAEDAAETDKAWQRWEKKPKNYEGDLWRACFQHPEWDHDVSYRRK